MPTGADSHCQIANINGFRFCSQRRLGRHADKLFFYSYDKKTNTYRRIEKPAYWIEKNGYMHFETELAGDIIITERPPERK